MHEVILVMSSQPTRRRVPAAWRTARRAVAALRAIHDEQVLMWELLWQSSRVAVDRAGPLAWQSSLDGPRLIGSDLPTPDDAAAGSAP
jgi:hypothetical protein